MRLQHCLRRTLSLLLAPAWLVLASCGGGSGPAPGLEPAVPTTWMQVSPGPTKIDGATITPTCSKAPGTDADAGYRFFARRGAGKGLMVFFGGGGTCWNDESCALPRTRDMGEDVHALYFAEIYPKDDPANYQGLLSLSDPANPVREWSMVYVPNCTGDMHGGANTAVYTDPATKQPFSIEHRGVDNVKVVMEWVKANFPDPGQLLVAGSSAGAYGAIVHYPRIRRAYPQASASLLADAPPMVMPAIFETTYKHNWNLQLDPEVYGSDAQATPTADLVKTLAAHFPGDRFSQYATATDMTLMDYYDAMANGLNGVVQGSACSAWMGGLRAGLAASQGAPNFRSYLAAGEWHTILGGTNRNSAGVPLFNREHSAAGVPFAGWVASQLSASGDGWTNAACTDCAAVPACPF